MTLASGANVGLSYVKEVTHGVTPGSPTMKALRAISRNINPQRTAIVSQERRQDRQVADMRHGFNQIQGSFGYELSAQSFDDILEGALGSAWAVGATTGSISLATNSVGNKVVRTSGSFITDGFYVGETVNLTGFVTGGNNGDAIVLAVTALELTVNKALTTDVAAAARTVAVKGKILKVGSTLTTYTFERRFNDVAQYQTFRGVAINQMSFQIQPDAMVQGTLDLIGMSTGGFSGTSLGAPTAAATNSPMVSFDAFLGFDDTILATVTGLNITLANGRTVQPVVGSKFSPDVFEGTCQVTGDLTAFFEDVSLYTLFDNEEEVRLWVKLNDLNGADSLTIMIPRMKTNSAAIDPPQEGPVTLQCGFQGLVDAISGTSILIQRGNV